MRDRTKVFRVARWAGLREAPSPVASVFIAGLALVFLGMALVGMWTEWRAGRPPLTRDTAIFALAAMGIGALPTISAVRETSTLVRMVRLWHRARRYDVRQVLEGVALPQWRSVANRPVRTVLTQIDGRDRYVRLAFARRTDAAALAPGPVRVELFDDASVRGPARLRQPYGMALAFASRLGDFPAKEVTVVQREDDWLNKLFDGWPDNDESGESGSGWPGDGDGGDGDGDGGE